jgi:hypothetical protein
MAIITPTEFARAEHVRREAGACLVDGQQVGSTLMCCHCGRHWTPIRGSGRIRGFCLKCMDVTCGSPECLECVPYQKRLELMER